jgi:hypothetical protein
VIKHLGAEPIRCGAPEMEVVPQIILHHLLELVCRCAFGSITIAKLGMLLPESFPRCGTPEIEVVLHMILHHLLELVYRRALGSITITKFGMLLPKSFPRRWRRRRQLSDCGW